MRHEHLGGAGKAARDHATIVLRQWYPSSPPGGPSLQGGTGKRARGESRRGGSSRPGGGRSFAFFSDAADALTTELHARLLCQDRSEFLTAPL
jgi:hypothetical protein